MNSTGQSPFPSNQQVLNNQFFFHLRRMKREKREEIVRKGVVEHERLSQQFEKKEKELKRQYEELLKRFEEERTRVRGRFIHLLLFIHPKSSTLAFIKNFFEKLRARWPSGQRCKLESVGTRVRFQPKSKIFFGGIKSLHQYIAYRFELNLNYKLN